MDSKLQTILENQEWDDEFYIAMIEKAKENDINKN